jgi:hypothetical protein
MPWERTPTLRLYEAPEREPMPWTTLRKVRILLAEGRDKDSSRLEIVANKDPGLPGYFRGQ